MPSKKKKGQDVVKALERHAWAGGMAEFRPQKRAMSTVSTPGPFSSRQGSPTKGSKGLWNSPLAWIQVSNTFIACIRHYNLLFYNAMCACSRFPAWLGPIITNFLNALDPFGLLMVLYHFVQLVRAVTRDRLDEILDSSYYWSYSRDIPSILSLRFMM